MTAKSKDLWEAWGEVDDEDISHIQSRVHRFSATAKVAHLKDTEPCARCMCEWIVVSCAFVDAQPVLRAPLLPVSAASGHGQGGAELLGMRALVELAQLPLAKATLLQTELLALGAVHVRELREADWKGLDAWATLLPFEQRRVLAALTR